MGIKNLSEKGRVRRRNKKSRPESSGRLFSLTRTFTIASAGFSTVAIVFFVACSASACIASAYITVTVWVSTWSALAQFCCFHKYMYLKLTIQKYLSLMEQALYYFGKGLYDFGLDPVEWFALLHIYRLENRGCHSCDLFELC